MIFFFPSHVFKQINQPTIEAPLESDSDGEKEEIYEEKKTSDSVPSKSYQRGVSNNYHGGVSNNYQGSTNYTNTRNNDITGNCTFVPGYLD